MFRRLVFLLAVTVVAFSAYRTVQAVASPTIASLDIDNDTKADFVVFRPSERAWYVLQNAGTSAFSVTSSSSTAATDTPVPSLDYNGDGKTDLARWRPATLGASALVGTWTIQLGPGFTSATSIQWGGAADQPLPGDWDGDGRIDVAYYNTVSKTLYVLQGGSNFTTAFSIVWGRTLDIALPGDWDGDGRIDLGMWRPSEQKVYVIQGGTSFTTAFATGKAAGGAFANGLGQTFLQGDFDGDNFTDLAVYSNATGTTAGSANVRGTWTIAQGGNSFATQFSKLWGGTAADTPLVADYDGDGRLDMAFYKTTDRRFYVLQGGTGFTTAFMSGAWGNATDVLIGSANQAAIP